MGSTLRVRGRKFPALINCTCIDWFHEVCDVTQIFCNNMTPSFLKNCPLYFALMLYVQVKVVVTIVPLLFPTLYGKRGIFARSPLLWVFKTLSFHCYHVHLPCFSLLTLLSLIFDYCKLGKYDFYDMEP